MLRTQEGKIKYLPSCLSFSSIVPSLLYFSQIPGRRRRGKDSSKRNPLFGFPRNQQEMVGAAEERELKRLETQVENGGGGSWDYLCLVRKLKVRCPNNVLKFGLPILKDPNSRSKLGSDGDLLLLDTFSLIFFSNFSLILVSTEFEIAVFCCSWSFRSKDCVYRFR